MRAPSLESGRLRRIQSQSSTPAQDGRNDAMAVTSTNDRRLGRDFRSNSTALSTLCTSTAFLAWSKREACN